MALVPSPQEHRRCDRKRNQRQDEGHEEEPRIDTASGRRSRASDPPGAAHTTSTEHHVDDAGSVLLTNDFLLMLDMSPTPEEAFDRDTAEYELALLWLDKLSTMNCNTLYQRRMRNAYMSHLSVCLNEKHLYGIFGQRPPQELEWVTFAEGGRPEAKAGGCCLAQARFSGGGLARAEIYETLRGCFHRQAQRDVLQVHRRSKSSPAKLRSPLRPYKRHRAPLQARRNMLYLLDCIRRELRGDLPMHTNDYLEEELVRYRDFSARHQHEDADSEEFAPSNGCNERVHLLLQMQNDLVKLLAE